MKQAIGILLLIGLIVGISIAMNKNKYQSTARSVTDFAIKDVSVIDRITLRNRNGEFIELKKNESAWIINDEYPAFKPVMDIFLNETISKIEIKGPVSKTARKNVIQMMVGNSVHVNLYKGNKELKSYYVGGATADQSGTYIHIEGSKTPYVAYIPGFTGILQPKFTTQITEWYSKSIFDFEPHEISSIEVVNYEDSTESFTLSKKDSSYTITPAMNNFNQAAAKSYFSLFKFKNFEGFPEYLTDASKDSVSNQTPYLVIKVNPVSAPSVSLKVYRKGSQQSDNTLVDKHGHLIVEDVERYYARFTGFNHLVTIQDYTFNNILIPRRYFQLD
jgi:hypothetical protein